MIWILMKNGDGDSLVPYIELLIALEMSTLKLCICCLNYDVRYDEQMEEMLDQVYEQFVARREGSTKQRKRARKKHSEDELLEVWLMCLSVQIQTLSTLPPSSIS